MAAGPRDTPHGRDTAADSGMSHEARDSHPSRPSRRRPRETPAVPESRTPMEPLDAPHSRDAEEPLGPFDPLGDPHALDPLLDRLELLGAAGHPGDSPGDDLGEHPADLLPPMTQGQSFRALRPQRRLAVWQLVPITALAVGGSLMFAFPLAFESGDAGPVVAMLGLLLCCCSAGWGLMAARRTGHTWPGLPPRGSGARADWRYVAGYAAMITLLAVLAVWRVARLR
jgi:hypothetical protein